MPPQPILIQLPGQAPVLGDRIVMTPDLPQTMPPGTQVPPSQIKVLIMGAFEVDVVDTFVKAVLSACQKADTDTNGAVEVIDLLALLAVWGPCPVGPDPCPGDIDGNGAVEVIDLLALLAVWGACP